jgi:uncharacterized protein
MLEMTLDSIRFTPTDCQWVVVLKEKNAERYLPIFMHRAEAAAIAMKLLDGNISQPSTQDLLDSTIDARGGSVQHSLVSQLDDKTFSAKVAVQIKGQVQELDCRPGDAIAMAVGAQVPIYAEEGLWDETGLVLDKEKDRFIP